MPTKGTRNQRNYPRGPTSSTKLHRSGSVQVRGHSNAPKNLSTTYSGFTMDTKTVTLEANSHEQFLVGNLKPYRYILIVGKAY